DIVRFEAVQQIPFPIEQVEWDYQIFQQADSPDVEVGIFAITKERVLNYLSNFRQVNVRVDALTQSPLAVYNAFCYDRAEEDDAGVIYMDIGTRSTDVIIAEQGQILPRTLPIGGNHFTEALVKAFKLSFPKAEKLKREAGTSKYARQIFQAMRPVFADLVQELQRSLGYYQSINRDANLTKLIGVGSTFRLPGLQKFLKQQLQIEVIRPDGYQRITADGKREAEFAEHAINMATAYGLALQGLGLETVSANLLPRHILTQRMWRAKQPWFAAAAACVAVGAGAMMSNYFMTQASYQRQHEGSRSQITTVLNKAQDNRSRWNDASGDSGGDPRGQIENLRRILDYRDLWPKVLEDISRAAAAADPQAETIAADYEAMQSLPRNQRQRIYIDSVESQFVVDPMTDTASGSGSASGYGGPGMARGVETPGLGENFTVDDFFKQGRRPPRFVITVRGTTPFQGGPAFMTETFLNWLRQNADRAGRPYRVVFVDRPLRMGQITEDGVDGDTVGRSGRSGRSGRTSLPAPRVGTGRGAIEPDFEAFGRGGMPAPRGGRGGRDAVSAEQLLPPRPLTTQRHVGDWEFEVQWEIELRPPDEARQEAPPTDEADPDEPTQARQPAEPADDERTRTDSPSARGEEAQL
ncbi:MAG: pilus assembly protein PilM, partial [Phycisphaeraceae bacterium]